MQELKVLTSRLMDAYVLGDKDKIRSIKSEIDEQSKKYEPESVSGVQLNSILNDDKASAIKMYEHLNRMLGDDWWEWEIETIHKMLFINGGVVLEEVNNDKMLAIRHCCRSDACFDDWYEFNQMALSFSGSIANFECLRSPSPGMAINAVKVIDYIRPDNEGIFGNEVEAYICVIMTENGIYTPPPSIVFYTKDKMEKMVSKEIVSMWPDILKKYNSIVVDREINISENIVDIQAKRLIVAETAARKYSR